MPSDYKIAVVGLWHLGEIYSAGLADLGHEVVGISDDASVVKNFNRGVPPLPEPHLGDLLSKNLSSGRLRYTTDFTEIKNCNALWLTFDTPVDENDDADLSSIWGAIEKSLPYLRGEALIAVTSQIPVGTSKKIRELIAQKRPALKFDYVYTPENLRLGEAVKCFMEPGRIVVGADSDAVFKKTEKIFSGLHAEILKMSPVSAEMAKHALNAYLATSVSFINDIADLCEKVGADVLDVAKALRSDPRIGQKAFLGAGLGFSGGTLGRDLRALEAAAGDAGIDLPVIESAYRKNLKRKDMVVLRLKALLGGLKGAKVALFGLTYKPGTKTLRRSRALEIAADLELAGAKLSLHDPMAEEGEIPKMQNANFFRDPYEASVSAKAIVIATPWPQFRDLDFGKLAEVASGAIFFDTPNLFYDKEEAITASGFKYFGVGR